MLKVFLTEDERLVREGLRDMIPWEQYGFVFAGEASDGEMALPLVRKIKPDVLIKTGCFDYGHQNAVHGWSGVQPPYQQGTAGYENHHSLRL